jgi:hypothetical protein
MLKIENFTLFHPFLLSFVTIIPEPSGCPVISQMGQGFCRADLLHDFSVSERLCRPQAKIDADPGG